MLHRILDRVIAREERRFGVPLNHLRELAKTSVAAFCKLLLLAPLANHRRYAPRDACHLARLAATQAEDCGACVQLAIYFARRDGVDIEVLQAALEGNESQLPTQLADVIRYAASISQGQDAPHLRERLQERYGRAAVLELGIAIATARFFPCFKRAIGYAQSCQLVRLEV